MKNNTYTLMQMGQVILDEIGSDPDKFYLFRKSGLLTDLLKADPLTIDRAEFRKVIGLPPMTLRIVVHYSLSLEQMITLGDYDFKDKDITAKRFPVNGKGAKEIVMVQLVKYDEDMSSDKVLTDLEANGLRPATIEELLSFGAAFPEFQKEFPVIALGSVAEVDGHPSIVSLGGRLVRELLIYRFDSISCSHSRHLAVRK